MAEEKLTIPYPDAGIFEQKPAAAQILNEGNITHILDHIEYTPNGTLVYIKDAKFPKKGFPFPEAVWAINIAKKFFIETVRLLSQKQMRGWALVFLLSFKSKMRLLEQALESYTRISLNVLSPYIVKYQHLTPCSKEVEAVTFTFLQHLGITDSPAMNTAKVVCAIIEYDDAYRYRLQDLMLETSKTKLLENPKKELNRLLDILISREHSLKVKGNIKNLRRLLNVMLLSRKIKKAFNKTVMQMDIVALQADKADKYWMDMRLDYDYGGVPFDNRPDVVLLKGYKLNV